MELRQVIYTSFATKEMDSRQLLDLLHEARGFNTVDNITGLLIHSDSHFMQVIEGDHENIEDLLHRLQSDPRHTDFHIVSDKRVHERLFPNWAMGCADFDDPVLATLPGVKTDPTDPDQVKQLVNGISQNQEAWRDILEK